MGLENCARVNSLMILRYHNVSWFRAVVLMWASVWMLAVPMFHVHPEAVHRHGEARHVHGGTVHTVLSSDLEDEFGSHSEVDGSGKTVHDSAGVSVRHPHPLHEHPEFGFSLLRDSTERKSFKPFLTQTIAVAARVLP